MCLPRHIKTKVVTTKVATCKRASHEIRVKNGLAVTPSEMMKLAERGIPVSAQSFGVFNDGESNPSWDIPLDRQRGVDAATLWQNEKDIKQKLRQAHAADRQKYD